MSHTGVEVGERVVLGVTARPLRDSVTVRVPRWGEVEGEAEREKELERVEADVAVNLLTLELTVGVTERLARVVLEGREVEVVVGEVDQEAPKDRVRREEGLVEGLGSTLMELLVEALAVRVREAGSRRPREAPRSVKEVDTPIVTGPGSPTGRDTLAPCSTPVVDKLLITCTALQNPVLVEEGAMRKVDTSLCQWPLASKKVRDSVPAPTLFSEPVFKDPPGMFRATESLPLLLGGGILNTVIGAMEPALYIKRTPPRG